jgi:hypothetical protein
MRATDHNSSMSTWRRLVGTSAAALLVLSVLAGSVQAAAPKWPNGHGTNYLAPTPSGASSSSVKAGNTVGFYEWLRNPGPNNISQLYMNVSSSPLATQVGVAWSIQSDSGTVVRTGTCTINTTPLCSFGALNAKQTVYVIAAFKTTSPALVDGGTQTVTLDFNATGIPPGDNNSHGDDVIFSDSVLISAASNGDANGDFNFNEAADLVVSTAAVGGTNLQSTSATVHGQAGIFVGDSPSLPAAKCTNALIAGIVAANPWFSCKKLTTLTSVVEVGNGKTFQNVNGGPGIRVVITFLQAPNQLNGAHPFTYHFFVDASGEHAELITALCNLVNGVPDGATPSEGCLQINGSSVTSWVFHNGGMKN